MNQLPDYIQNRQSRGLAARVSQNLGTSSPPYLSIMDNQFTLVDGAGNEQPIPTYEGDPAKCMRGQSPGPYADVVIIDVNDHVSQIYYDQPFERGAASWTPPPCFSHNGKAPSSLARVPQAKTCTPDPTGTYGCRWSVWGSGQGAPGSKTIPPACGQYQLIAIMVAGHDMPFLLRIPPNSLKNYRAYAEQFRGQPFDMDGVLTRLSFISQGTLAFIPCAYVAQASLALADKLLAAKATDAMVGRLDVPIQGMLPAPTPAAPLPLGAQTVGLQSTPMAAPLQQPQGQSPSATPVGASPISPQPSGRGRRRNTAAAQPAANVAQAAQPMQTQAPFMIEQPPVQAAPSAAPIQPNGPTFGMSPGVPPNPELAATLDNLFGAPKQ